MAPTTPSVNALAFFNASTSVMAYLWSRWQEEKQHEEIREYEIPLRAIAEQHNAVVVKFSARPFGFVFMADGRTYRARMTSKRYSYARIA